ncbi:BlaI/MecI/CopY family transcriptional regulator [Algiphilus sp.]|uniref:BlaI/MecI/CopY family transcriptional regulator n=1 Tax=Algiphilus sp. TaxID=1872431 RepID=UPI003B521EC2
MALRLYHKQTPPLGDLERDVMEVLWHTGTCTAQAIHAALADTRGLTLSTVQSTVERLSRKQLVHREKQGRAYCYRAVLSREHLLARLVAELVTDFSAAAPRAGVGIVDLSEGVDDATLSQLEAWVADTRRSRRARGSA